MKANKNKTQTQVILAFLKKGGRLTVISAIRLFGVYALSQRIGELSHAGHRIKKRWFITKNKKRVMQYSI